MISSKSKMINKIIFMVLCVVTIGMLYPLFFILNNSFKGKFYISSNPFSLPNEETFSGISNYINGVVNTGLLNAIGWSFFITILSLVFIILFTSMTAYYIARVKTIYTKILYYMFVFSMIVPFQMVMFTMTNLADTFNLRNPVGISLLYLGFGSGLSVFMFTGFIRSIPIDMEEAAMIDGCTPLRTFFSVMLPIIKPTAITVAILNAMWIWNDFLLPYLVIGVSTKYKTIPVVVQMLVGSNGNKDLGALMATLVISIIPIIIFYLSCQKHIISGVVAGAVKG